VTSRPRSVLWLCALGAAAIALLTASRDVFWNGDFYLEAYPAYEALMGGDPGLFAQRLPGYSGFATLVGAPAALLTGALGGQETMVFRLTAVPGLAALAWLAVALGARARAAGGRWWLLVAALAAGGPLVYRTLIDGHPEDLLASAAAVGAVLAARASRPTAAGLLLILAVVSKQWAVLAIGPALLAAPAGRARIALLAGAGLVLVLGTQVLVHPLSRANLTTTGALFHPHQLWWPFGVDATPAFVEAGHGERMAPGWLQGLTRPLIVGLGVALPAAWWLRAGRERDRDDALALLALLFALRCLLDPWNLVYYHLPLVEALLAWEVLKRRDPPVLTIAATAAAWLTFVVYDARTGDGPWLAYLAWTLPLLGYLGHTLLARPRAAAPLRSRRPWPVDPSSAARRSSPSTSTT
jgi:hypothetical protein